MTEELEILEKLLSNEEMINEICKVAFADVDKDNSGEIDINEFEKAINEILKNNKLTPLTKDEVQKFMNALDTDKSGKLDFNEFSKFIRIILGLMIQEIRKAKNE